MDFSTPVGLWWLILCCITGLNLLLFIYSNRVLNRKIARWTTFTGRFRAKQLALSSVYMLLCGSRAILPRGDLRRIVFFDHWTSSILVGRTVATVAELSFVYQWSLLLRELGKSTNDGFIKGIANYPFILIIFAEISSWYACTTSNYLGTVIEESLWAVAAFITVIGLLKAQFYYFKQQRFWLWIAMLLGSSYIVYMVTVDVPTYWNAWQVAEASGTTYKSISEGFSELANVWHPTLAYEDWRYEMVWMSLYFSVAVWISMAIAHLPAFDEHLKKKTKDETA